MLTQIAFQSDLHPFIVNAGWDLSSIKQHILSNRSGPVLLYFEQVLWGDINSQDRQVTRLKYSWNELVPTLHYSLRPNILSKNCSIVMR